MKYVVLVGDGMADESVPELKNQTPLEAAKTPNLDALTQKAEVFGLTRTIPDGFEPGSDVGNMSIFGYDPIKYYTGRAPIEAVSMGIDIKPGDVAVRCNLVKLVENGNKKIMEDYSAGHIKTDLAHQLIKRLKPEIENASFELFPGVSYRNILLWHNGNEKMKSSPPHNIPGQEIDPHLPTGDGSDILNGLIKKSWPVLKDRQANSIWLWGAGKKPNLPSLNSIFGITGAVISAVDLVKGLGLCAGLEVIDVPGATGYLDTNYKGKVEASLEALKTRDLVYLHIEAPDETGHEGSASKKVQAIEDFDQKVVGPLVRGLERISEYALLLMPDHPTPVQVRTHTSDPVPFLIYRSKQRQPVKQAERFTESNARRVGLIREKAHLLMKELLSSN